MFSHQHDHAHHQHQTHHTNHHLPDVSMAEVRHAADAAIRASHDAGTYNAQQHASLAKCLLELDTLVTEAFAAIATLVTGTADASGCENPGQREGAD